MGRCCNLSRPEFDVLIELFPSRTESKILYPTLVDGITLERHRKMTPSVLKFKVLKDEWMSFGLGTLVRFKIRNNILFVGYVFSKHRTKKGIIECTAYDQLRYLKLKTTQKIEKTTAQKAVKTLVAKNNIKIGLVDIPNKNFLIPSYIAEDKEILEVIDHVTKLHNINTGELYVLYDDNGKIFYRNILNMYVKDQLFDIGELTDWDYYTSIDNSYNSICVNVYNDTKLTSTIIQEDKHTIGAWGLLRYTAKSTEDVTTIKKKAEGLLSILNREERKLTLKGALGNVNVRGGSLIGVNLNLGDMELFSWMLVESVTHNFDKGVHTMDIKVVNASKGFGEMLNPDGVFEFEPKEDNEELANSGSGRPKAGTKGKNNNAIVGKQGDGRVHGIYKWPVGAWCYPTTDVGHTNFARDFPVPYGTPIYASDGGTVTVVQWWNGYSRLGNQSYGHRVDIVHGNSRLTRYAHMSRIVVTQGQRVTQGQIIGYVGSTGNSDGPHLHFEIVENGRGIDPIGRVRYGR